MVELIFLGTISCLFAILLGWGFVYLPDERWQMLAVLPVHKSKNDSWHGLNITYYGFFVATSQLFSLTLLVVLLGSLTIPLTGILLTIVLILSLSIPAARIVAMLVEKKRHTFTIAGAAFIGVLVAPVAIVLSSACLQRIGVPGHLPLIPTLSALALCYMLGEGLGRLACVSYGCCYGKPVCTCSINAQRLLRNCSFIFTGSTKKAVYEGHLAGQPLVPIQAITAVIYTAAAIVCCGFFLYGWYTTALLGAIVISQAWRLLSETLRADFRGFSSFTAYQKMAVATIAYVVILVLAIPSGPTGAPTLHEGISTLWHPGLILSLQGIWLLVFVLFGRSTVTSATVSFSVINEHI